MFLRNFIEMLLGIAPHGSPLPETPSEQLISKPIQPTTEELVSTEDFFEIPSSDARYYGGRKGIPGMHKDQCMSDVKFEYEKIGKDY
ncbi:hypothetical protein O181_056823 [Austropuccinia psidii MF-1]|uniref:Uncharacterized protein n=1 Tax=Austropuccinia psidii MF-1 TaxID=1389203 RepID=A0A9Q3EDU0_9BASI|nr:hypothetical protein [Austropuccinia psidii MF-1]